MQTLVAVFCEYTDEAEDINDPDDAEHTNDPVDADDITSNR